MYVDMRRTSGSAYNIKSIKYSAYCYRVPGTVKNNGGTTVVLYYYYRYNCSTLFIVTQKASEKVICERDSAEEVTLYMMMWN